jgi:small subunit ribosomal protein S15
VVRQKETVAWVGILNIKAFLEREPKALYLPPEKRKITFAMYLTTEIKQDLFKKHGYGKKKEDTGSAESQIALFTHRINHLTAHLKQNKKDFSTQQGLMKLVGKRKKLLNYLQMTNIERYRAILAELDLRK